MKTNGSDTHIKLPQVGFLFPSQDLQGRGLPDTVGPHQPQNLSGSGNRQPAATSRDKPQVIFRLILQGNESLGEIYQTVSQIKTFYGPFKDTLD